VVVLDFEGLDNLQRHTNQIPRRLEIKFHLGDESLDLQIGKSPAQTHSPSISKRKRRERVDGFSDRAQTSLVALALRILEPPLRLKPLGLWEIPLLVADDHVLEDDLHLKQCHIYLEILLREKNKFYF